MALVVDDMADVADQDALALQALDLLPFGIVACDGCARLAFGNRIIDRMVGGLRAGQPASGWAHSYGLSDATGNPYGSVDRIPLVAALKSPQVGRERMHQRCGHGSVELISHTRAVRSATGRLLGAVGVFLPSTVGQSKSTGGDQPLGRHGPTRRTDPQLVAAAVEFAGEVVAPATRGDALAEQIADYVAAHRTERIRADDIADAFGYNATYLTTLLRRRTGESLTRLVLRVRMDSARQLLEVTDLPIGAVAARAGPWDGEYFARLFRRRFGCSPSVWRSTCKSEESSSSR